ELPDALARQAELGADRLERAALAAEPEAELDDPSLPLGERRQRPAHGAAPVRVGRRLDGVDRRLVREQLGELAVAVRADALVQRHRRLDGVERLLDVLELQLRRVRELLRGRLTAELRVELGRRAAELHAALLDVNRDADRAGLVRDRTLAGLADPPGRVGRELVALPPVELLDRAVEADHAVLDQVEQRHAVTLVALRDRDDEPQVGVDHALLRREVAALDTLRQLDL